MKKPLITALLLVATSAAAQAAPADCTPAIGNWVNAAPTTCRFVSRGQDPKDKPVQEVKIPNEMPPTEEPPGPVPE